MYFLTNRQNKDPDIVGLCYFSFYNLKFSKYSFTLNYTYKDVFACYAICENQPLSVVLKEFESPTHHS